MAWYAGRSTVCKCGDVVAGYNFENKGEGTVLLRFLGKFSLHNTCYRRTLGISAVLAVRHGVLPMWYFAGAGLHFAVCFFKHLVLMQRLPYQVPLPTGLGIFAAGAAHID